MGRQKKGDNLIILSLRVEKEMVEAIDEMVEQFKTISRTEFIRMAIEFAMDNKNFQRNIEKLD